MLKLNLLPPQGKKEAKLEMINQTIMSFGIIIFLFLLISALLVFVSQVFLNMNLEELEDKITFEQSREQIKTIEDLESRIKYLNERLILLDSLQDKQSKFSDTLEKIIQEMPLGIQLHSLSINKELKKITLTGYAPAREQVLEIKDNLEKSAVWTDVYAPLSNFVDPRDIDFQFSFLIKD